MTRMTRPFTAAILAAALAFSPVAAPSAQAQNVDQERLGQVLGALAILGIAGYAYNERKDRKEQRRAAEQEVQRRAHQPDRYNGHRQGNHRVIPARCIRHVETNRGTRRVVGQRCLQRQGVGLRRVPNRCATEAYVGNRWRPAYRLGCMRKSGWRVAQHR